MLYEGKKSNKKKGFPGLETKGICIIINFRKDL